MTALQRGDVIELGRHRLMCGDAFSAEDRAALLQGVKPDMLFCDPPYGMRYASTKHGMTGYGLSPLAIERPRIVRGDEDDFDPTSLIDAFAAAGEQFWWGADYYAERLPRKNEGSWVVWDKRLNENADKMFGSCFELCWSKRRHQRAVARVKWAGIFGLSNEPGRRRCHPTQKPVKLAEWFISRYSKENAAILDLFAGSGSTLLACERLNRTGYVMEIDPDYCQVIIDRYEALREKSRLPLLDGVAS